MGYRAVPSRKVQEVQRALHLGNESQATFVAQRLAAGVYNPAAFDWACGRESMVVPDGWSVVETDAEG